MDSNKRNFLALMIPAVLTIPFGSFSNVGQSQTRVTPSPPPPAVSEMPVPDAMPKLDPKDILKKNQEQIHDNVEKIYALAGELKDEVEKTDSVNVLSLPMVQKAERIEKLAKQVKNLARGD